MYAEYFHTYLSFLTGLGLFCLVLILLSIIFNKPDFRDFVLNLVGILAFPASLPISILVYYINERIENKQKADKEANDFLTEKINERIDDEI